MFSCSPAKPPVCAARESSFSPMMCTFWRCFCGERLRRASSRALSSQSGRPGRRWPPGPPGRKLGRRGAEGAFGRATGGVAVPAPAPVLVGASGRRGAGAVGLPTGFCSCMSSPGATGLRIPAGMPGRPGAPGRVGAPGRPLPVLLPSRRIGLPTSSRVLPLRGHPGATLSGGGSWAAWTALALRHAGACRTAGHGFAHQFRPRSGP